MGENAEATKEWERRQRKAFSQWCGILLQEKDFDLLNLSKGVTFFLLVEGLMKKPLPFNWQKPMSKQRVNQLEVISLLQRAVDALNKEGVARDVSGKDIYNGNLKLLMGMVWNFILKFQVVDKQLLFDWCEKTCSSLGITITNFGSSWVDGRAFCCLVSSLRPDILPKEKVESLKPEEKKENLDFAFTSAESIGIQSMLEPDDMLTHRPNERIVMLYLSYFYKMSLDEPTPARAPSPPPAPTPEPPPPVDNSELEYLKSELESMVKKYQALHKKYETLRYRSKEEAEYLINSQQGLLKQLQTVQADRVKLNKKLKAVKAKLKLLQAEKEATVYHVDPPGDGPVAIVCTGVQGSASLWQEYPKAMGAATALHNALIKHIAHEFNGYEMKWEGDSYTFVFGKVTEAVEFCAKVQLMMPSEHWPKALLEASDCETVHSSKDSNLTIFSGLRVKIGMAYGKSNRVEDPMSKKVNFSGITLNKAQSLVKAAAGGQILVGVEEWIKARDGVEKSNSEPTFFQLGEFSFTDLKLVEEVGQIVPKVMAERYFPPILTDANLDEVSQVLADELNRLSEENKRLKNSIEDMENKAEDARRRATLLQSWLESMSEAGDPTITGGDNNELLSITKDLTALTKEKDDMSCEIQSLKEENGQMANYLKSLNDDLREARALAHGLKDKVDYLKEDRVAAQKRVEELQAELNKLKARKIKVEEAKTQKTEEVVVLTEENKEIQEKIHVLEEEIEVLKKIKIENPKKNKSEPISWIEPVPKKSREERERERQEKEDRRRKKEERDERRKQEKRERRSKRERRWSLHRDKEAIVKSDKSAETLEIPKAGGGSGIDDSGRRRASLKAPFSFSKDKKDRKSDNGGDRSDPEDDSGFSQSS